MKYAACVVPVAPVRIKPAHEIELGNQLLFSDAREIRVCIHIN